MWRNRRDSAVRCPLPAALAGTVWARGAVCAIALAFAGAAFPVTAHTETGAYPLSRAFRDALERDPRVRAAQGRVSEAREALEEVRSGNRPSVFVTGDAGYSYNRNEARTVDAYNGASFDGGLTVTQSVWDFGRIAGRLQRAEAEIQEAEAAAKEVRQEVLAEVARSFAGYWFRERILDGRRDFESLVEELGKAARRRLSLGTLDRTELHELRLRLSRARAKRIEASSEYRVARTRLARLTGADRPVLSAASLARLREAVPPTLDEALQRARNGSPGWAVVLRRLEAAEGELTFRKADLLPSLSLDARAQTGRVGDIRTFDMSGRVRLSVSLYEGGEKRARRRRAILAVEVARRELTAEWEQIEIAVQSNWDLLESLTMATGDFKTAVAEARTAADLTRIKLDAGQATFVDHVEARHAALDAEFARLDNALRVENVRIDILRILGVLHDIAVTEL